MTVAAYRYGSAPECGKSYNYANNTYECGVSMASVSGLPENNLFATLEAKQNRKAFYYIGTVCGTGGDDEVCLSNVKRITKKEYTSLIKSQENKDFYNSVKAVKNAKIEKRIAELEARFEDKQCSESWMYYARYNSNIENDKKEIEIITGKMIKK